MGFKKKILIACDSSRTLLAFRGNLIEELAAGHEVHVFTPKVEQQHVRDTLQRLGVHTVENGLNGSNVSLLSDVRYILDLYTVIRKLKPDVFFPYTLKPVIYGSLVASFCKVGLILC